MRCRYCLRIAVLGSGLVLWGGRAAASDADPRQHLDALRKAMTAPTPGFYTEFRGTARVDAGKGAEGVVTEELRSLYFRRADDVDVTFELRRPRPGATAETIGRRAISDDEAIMYDTVQGSVPADAVYSNSGPRYRGVAMAQLQGAEALEGLLARDEMHFWEVLSSFPQLRAVTEDAPGNGSSPSGAPGGKLLHLSGRGAHGSYDVWCGPESYAVVRALVVKREGDVFGRGKLGRLTPGVLRTAIPNEFRFEMIVSEWGGDGGFRRIDRASINESRVLQDGRRAVVQKTFHRTAFEASPDFAGRGAFMPTLRDNTPLKNLDAAGLALVWRDKKAQVVANTDAYKAKLEGALRELEQGGPRGTASGSPWTGLRVLGLLLLAVAAVVITMILFRKRYTARHVHP